MKTDAPTFKFQGQNLLQIAMPLGGIGAGSVCLNGYGGIQDYSIRHKPSLGPLPDRFIDRDAAFGIIKIKGNKGCTRLLEGPIPREKIFNMGLHGNGYVQGRYEGLPRFQKAVFSGAYPFGEVALNDQAIPLDVTVTGWSPLIPLDDVASGAPAAILEYTFRNNTAKNVDFDFCYSLSHLAPDSATLEGTRNDRIPRRGIFFHNTLSPDHESFGSASLSTVGFKPLIKTMWLRGGWLDAISALWREIETEKFNPNDGKAGTGNIGRNGGSILISQSLPPGGSVTIPVVITWHFPNSSFSIGELQPDSQPDKNRPRWHPFYTSHWQNSREVADFIANNYTSLRTRTQAFRDALFSSTLPREVIDAVSSNLAILKAPTILRQQNGNLWAWEGCFIDEGSCHGTCTHVWNYAQVLPHLFPQIERTLREQELERSMDERGHVNFRAALPDGPTDHKHHAAADGQLGGIMKLYRDWQISDDTAWLRRLYPLAQRSIEFCIRQWDPERIGLLVEPHHNTYDIEFWGPDGMCNSIYVGALSAMSLLAKAVGKNDDAHAYRDLANRAVSLMDSILFNGEYYEQKVQYRGLQDQSFVNLLKNPTAATDRETLSILKKEGPKYQYGKGCLADGIIGAWMAELYGIPTPFKPRRIRKALQSIFRHNFRESLITHTNPQRPGYAWGNEAGLLICSWPNGGKPTLPFPYSDEVMTGMEYQVATHLISNGFVREGLRIVKATRSRHDGHVRNPWNEYECGSFYARAMASYALLSALSGFRYSAVEKTLWIDPKIKKPTFKTFFSTAFGYGTIRLDQRSLTIELLEGSLAVEKFVIFGSTNPSRTLAAAEVVTPQSPLTLKL